MNDLMEPVRLAKVRSWTISGVAREIREGNGLSLAEIGAAIPASPSTVCRWELGQRIPRGERALRYLEVLEGLIGR